MTKAAGILRLVGGPAWVLAQLSESLHALGLRAEAEAEGAPATLLVTLNMSAGEAIAAAEAFAGAQSARERLAVLLWSQPRGWPDKREAAVAAAFIRHAALAWAPRRLRVNGVTFASVEAAGPILREDIAGTVSAMLRWPSMTGQTISLGVS